MASQSIGRINRKTKVKEQILIYIGETDDDLIYGEKYKCLFYDNPFGEKCVATYNETKINNTTSICSEKLVDIEKFVSVEDYRNIKIEKLGI